MYRSQLETCRDKSKVESEQELINSLIKSLDDNKTHSEVISLFSSALKKRPNPSSNYNLKTILSIFNRRPTLPVKTVYDQLQKWIEEEQEGLIMAKEAKDNLVKISEKIKEIANYKKIEPLINLLEELFKNEDILLLNIRGKSLLACIKDLDLPAVLTYLANLSNSEPAATTQTLNSFSSWSRGSFEAQPNVDEIHSGCKLLMSKVAKAAQRDSSNPNWEKSNSLLQTAIIIYTEINDSAKNDLVVEYT